jgi:hypothetical protein
MGIDARARDNCFHLSGVNDFPGHADAVQFGDVGEKKTPATQENDLSVRESVPRHKLTVDALAGIVSSRRDASVIRPALVRPYVLQREKQP